MKVGDLVGYINGDGPTGIVLATWSEWAEDTYEGRDEFMETWAEVLWSDGNIDTDCDEMLEVINESR